MKRSPLIGLTALALAALSCDLGGLGVVPAPPEATPPPPMPSATPEPTPPPPTVAAQPTAPPPTVAAQPTAPPPAPTREPSQTEMLVDRFEDNRYDWFEGAVSEAETFVAEGRYQIDNPFEEGVDNFVFGVTRAFSFADFDLVVEITQVSGTDDNELATVFGYEDRDNFFEFALSGLGYVALFQWANGEFVELEAWFASGHVLQGSTTNRVRLLLEGTSLTAYVNGQRVLEKRIPGYQGGFVGLGCGPLEPPHVYCTFDNLEITEL